MKRGSKMVHASTIQFIAVCLHTSKNHFYPRYLKASRDEYIAAQLYNDDGYVLIDPVKVRILQEVGIKHDLEKNCVIVFGQSAIIYFKI